MSLAECAFCQPNMLNWRQLTESEQMLSFLSDPRLAYGHSIVIPRRHVVPPEPLTNPEKVAILTEVERLRQTMLGSFALGVDIFQKTRPHVPEGKGTKMDHYHMHVVPSKEGDEVYDQGLIWAPDRFGRLPVLDAQNLIQILHRRAAT